MSIVQPLNFDQSFNNQKQKPQVRPAELKLPELQFTSWDTPHVNFQMEVCKLVQANAIISELIKEAALEKYALSEKIHLTLEHIKKLEAKNAIK